MSRVAHRGLVHVEMNVSKDSIAVAVLSPDRGVAEIDKPELPPAQCVPPCFVQLQATPCCDNCDED